MYVQPYTVSIPPMNYGLLKNLSEKFGWIVEPDTELEFNETTNAAISESKLKVGKRFKDVESLILDLQ